MKSSGPATLGELRKWIECSRRGQRRASGAPAKTLRREAELGACGGASVEFVEFSGAQLLGAASGAVVEVVDGAGLRLTIRLPGGQPLDVAAVVAAFGGARR